MTGYTVFLLAFAASAAAPGPEIAALLGRVLSGGLRGGMALLVGIVLGKLVMLTAAILGLSALVGLLGPVFLGLKYIGAAWLIWLGVKKWRNAGQVLATTQITQPSAMIAEIGLGLAMTLSNPIAILFYVALLPGVVDIAAIDMTGYLTLCAIIVGVMGAVALAYGLVAELARRLFASAASKTRIDQASGVMLAGAGVLIAARS